MSSTAPTTSQSRSRRRYITQCVTFIVVFMVIMTFAGWSADATTSRFGGLGWIHWWIGFFSFVIGLLLARATVKEFLDIRSLKIHAVHPEAVLADGQKVALSGRIRIDGCSVKAPFSGTDCAGYSYKVSGERSKLSDGSTHSRRQLCLMGYALASAFLECGSRRFEINAIPDFHIDLWTNKMGGEWGRLAFERIRDSAETMTPVGELEVQGEMGSARERVKAPEFMDFFVAPTQGTDNTINVDEYILPMDSDVTLLARYSSGPDGLDGGRSGEMKVFPGTMEALLASLGREFSKDWKTAVALLAVGLSLLGLFWWLP